MFICVFHLVVVRVFIRVHFCHKFEFLSTLVAMLVHSYHCRAEKSWFAMYLILLPHMQDLSVMLLILTCCWQKALTVVFSQILNIHFKKQG